MNSNFIRCPWVDLSKPDYVAYHDEEWGVPVHDDRKFFELLTLEAARQFDRCSYAPPFRSAAIPRPGRSQLFALTKVVLVLVIASVVAGCGHRYHLKGHRDGNLQHPPDVHLRMGESKLAVTEGLSIKSLVPASALIRIEDESIAKVVPPVGRTANIEAIRVGRTRASYVLVEVPNEGFWIIVAP